MKPLSELAPDLWAGFDDKKKSAILFMEKREKDKKTPYKDSLKIINLDIPQFEIKITDREYLDSIYTDKGKLTKCLVRFDVYCLSKREFPFNKNNLFLSDVKVELFLTEKEEDMWWQGLEKFILNKLDLNNLIKKALNKI